MPRKQKSDVQIPEEYEDAEDGWKAAYVHAFSRGCSEKASILYASAHDHDFEEGGVVAEDVDALKAEIARLKAEAEANAT